MSSTTPTSADLTDAQRRMFRGSFWLFILAETMIFVTLFSTRFLLAYGGHPAGLNRGLGLTVTALLLASMVPVLTGLAKVRANTGGAGHLRLGALLGLIAIAAIVWDWATLSIPIGDRYGENYALSTGYHALHIVLGLVALTIVAGGVARHEFRPTNHWQVEAAAVFWGFVTLSWIALYIVFFIL